MDLIRIKSSTEFSSEFQNNIYIPHGVKSFALTAAIAIPVIFNSLDASYIAVKKQKASGEVRYSITTGNGDFAKSTIHQIREKNVSMIELAKTLFPEPVELSGVFAKKHSAAISSFFIKTK